uniref:Uncharacterized protein n=1 Tax=Anopheles minimus TaxID=112268 RepID=A0A182VX84_9DIPT
MAALVAAAFCKEGLLVGGGSRKLGSVTANFCPMQFRGPALNGMYWYGFVFSADDSTLNRSGSNFSGFGKVQPKRFLDDQIQIAHIVQHRQRNRLLTIVAHNVAYFVEHFLLNVGIFRQTKQYEADGGCGRIMSLEHERIHLLTYLQIRQWSTIDRCL